jgi:hypothetical protein
VCVLFSLRNEISEEMRERFDSVLGVRRWKSWKSWNAKCKVQNAKCKVCSVDIEIDEKERKRRSGSLG